LLELELVHRRKDVAQGALRGEVQEVTNLKNGISVKSGKVLF
jgi:hypothetical protein